MKEKFTQRGFGIIEFNDRYGHKCSLQESSIVADEQGSCIWFGPDEPDTQMLVPGRGWQPVPMPQGVDVVNHTRMHLSQKQVKKLLPYLKHFAKHGCLPVNEKKREKVLRKKKLLTP